MESIPYFVNGNPMLMAIAAVVLTAASFGNPMLMAIAAVVSTAASFVLYLRKQRTPPVDDPFQKSVM